jgi:pimeloyl-ACP methyl ester carboxylesterase
MSGKYKFDLPVGYHEFHKDQLFNFQLNRWHSLGFARFEDMKEAGNKIHNFLDWKSVLVQLADKALSENRLMNAAIYYRGAEFYITQKDPDKEIFYDKFIDLFYRVFRDDGIERIKVPYQNRYLSGMRMPPIDQKKGMIIMHGGFDSFIEEFYPIGSFFADRGFEVIAFEGPGQGGTRKKYGLAWNHEWENPVGAVLDYFNLDDVTLYGLSMGGYLCLRAAAFEPRVKRVVASGHAIDYMKTAFLLAQWLIKPFMKYENFMNKMIRKKMVKDPKHHWLTNNMMYITDTKEPIDAVNIMLQMNKKNMHPERITQDVLILTSRNDHFIPIKMHKMQINALTNSKSVSGRIFTKDEHAQNHCQIGNIGLSCKVIINWVDEKSSK